MKRIFRSPTSAMHNLRSVIAASRASEHLSDLPDRLAQVIERFEALDVDPRFRDDVYQVLNGSIDIALSMVDLTFPIEHVGSVIAEQLQILSRVMVHLQTSPTSKGYAILLPDRGQLVGHFSTESEAQEQLTRYRALGISPNCLIVPTMVRSLHAVQPKALPAPTVAPIEEPPPTFDPTDTIVFDPAPRSEGSLDEASRSLQASLSAISAISRKE